MSTEDAQPRNLFDELRAVARWRRGEEARLHARMKEYDDEVDRLLDNIGELENEVTRLRVERFEVEAQLAELDIEEERRARRAFLAGTAADAGIMEARAFRLKALREALPAIDELAMSPRVPRPEDTDDEFTDLPTEAEAQALQERSDAIRVRLRLAAREAFPRRVQVSVVTSVDPPEGPPRVFVAILPVSFDTYLRWNSRGHELSAVLAWRVIAHLSGLMSELGAPDALFRYIPFEGQLAVQIWVAQGDLRGDIRKAWEARFSTLCDQARELEAANIELRAAWVGASLLRLDDPTLEGTHARR